MSSEPARFPFAFDRPAAAILRFAGVRPETAWVLLTNDQLSVHFGRLRLTTTLENVFDTQVTGPYNWLKAVGVHVSLADKGVTFGTNAKAGVCVRFRTPVEGVGRRLGLRHTGMTVTVADPASLKSAIDPLLLPH